MRSFWLSCLLALALQPAWADTASDTPWWKHAVIYEIYTRSFADSNGDGIGDLNGITGRLDYLADLGIDAVWLTPFYPSPNVDFGYDIAHYMEVSPEYGTLADFDRLLAEADKRGIRILADLVLNHTSDQHPWFGESRSSRDAPRRDWYVWRDGRAGGPPNNWQSIFGGSAWEFDETTGQYYYHFFYKEQPDLNWRNPAVRDAFHDVARFWLDRGVAGFRLDVPDTLLEHPDLPDNPINEGLNWVGDPNMDNRYNVGLPGIHDIMRDLRGTLDQYPDKVLLGETGSPETIETLLRWYGDEQDELQLAMNFLFTGVRGLSASGFGQRIGEAEAHAGQGWPVYLLSNHDRPRQMNRYGDGANNREIAKLLATMLLTLRGTTILYYGEELGMLTHDPQRLEDVQDPIGRLFWPNFKGRDGSRTPMQWDRSAHAGFSTASPWVAMPPDAADNSVAAQLADPTSVLKHYRALLALRKKHPALLDGAWQRLNTANEDVLAYWRSTGDETLLVAMNMSADQTTLPLGDGVQATSLETLLSSHGEPGSQIPGEITLLPFQSWLARVVGSVAP